MTEMWQQFYLSVIQGLTEFLPVSSSAHLILVPYLLQWPEPGLAFDVAVHGGTLCAVMLYFRAHLKKLILACLSLDKHSSPARLEVLYLMIASLPVGVLGFLAHDLISQHARDPRLIASTTICFGILLGLASRVKRGQGRLDPYRALCLGLAQALALIPGTSRSGITLTAGLFLGLDRQTAARFSFLLSIPVISAACGLELTHALSSPQVLDWPSIGRNFGVAFVTGLLTIKLFMRVLARMPISVFVIYRLLLGCFILLRL